MRRTGHRSRDAAWPGYQQKHVWMNDGAGQFKEVAQLVGVTDVYDGRSVALADFGNRGVLDAVVANQKGPVLLYRNTVSPGNQWMEFELEGSASNRSAIGAQVQAVLEWPAAIAGSFGRQRLLRREPAAAAFRIG